MRANPREIAVKTLSIEEKNFGFAEEKLNKLLDKSGLYKKDRSLARELTLGCIRWRRTIEWLLFKKLSSSPPPTVIALLSIGIYQLFWMDRIPFHAAVNESVELCKKFGYVNHRGLVNAVLRAYGREKEEVMQLLKDLKKNDPALGYSHPQWLYERWKNQLGTEDALALMNWDNIIPAPFLRVNTLQIQREFLLKSFKTAEVEAEAIDYPFLDEQLCIRLSYSSLPHQLPGYHNGWFYMQDPAAQMAVQLLNPQPFEFVLDACAAPGGKTTYIAQRMKNQGHIIAVDIRERLALIQENCTRLGINIVETVTVEDFKKRVENIVLFDKILLDVPCSNTGVLRRRVEARYRLNEQELERLVSMQAHLLEDISKLVKKGGCLVYSTCSIDYAENREQIELFLKKNPDFKLSRSKFILPHREKTDGAFAALLIRE